MYFMKSCKLLTVPVLLILAVSSAFGQGATSQVFPQLADGVMSDGSSFMSFLSVTNLNNVTADCTVTSVGVPADRFSAPLTRSLPAGFTFMNVTKGQGAFTSGYASLDCSQPVQAMLMYVLISPQGGTLGMATVPAAPKSSYASFPALTGIGLQYGVAIANPSSAPISVQIAITQASQSTSKTITIPARGRFVGFLDSVVNVPSTPAFSLFEMASSSQFNVTALIFDGSVFSTIIPAVMP